jgi:RNA-directed DNA polymerase
VRTSECGNAASKRPPSRSPLDGLVTDGPWVDAIELFRLRNPRRRERIAAYEALVERGQHVRIGAEVLAGTHRPDPPEEGWLNKLDGRRKRIFRYDPPDELLFRVVNRLLQPAASEAASPWCRSFLPGGGARAAFRSVLADRELEAKGALRLDVRDYFNSIDVDHLLSVLPTPFDAGPAGTLLRAALLDPRVRRAGSIVHGGQKGVMAGTPIAPVLATLYLRDLDAEVAATGATYARYSDDVLVLAPPAELPGLDRLVRRRLEERGLDVNESKSAITGPAAPWDFLGFRYALGDVGLAPVTSRKLRARTTRLARGLLRWRERTGASPERTVAAFFRRTNRRLYGIPAERAEFSWSTWFLPMLDRPDGLRPLDEHLQRECRYAATGRRTARTRQAVPYDLLVEHGHLPLVTAYWAARDGVDAYETLVGRRTGLSAPARR